MDGFYTHNFNYYGTSTDVATEKLKLHLSPEYLLKWYLQTDPDSVFEIPYPAVEWASPRKLTLPILQEYKVFMASQRALMDAAIAATEQELSNA